MNTPTVSETHIKTARKIFDRYELKRILAQLVANQANMGDVSAKNMKVEIKFEDETEGSPAYTVGKRAIVELTLDLANQPAAESDA